MHPRSKHWHLIDYVLTRQKDVRDVLHTRVMPSAECHTDHRLVRCKLKLHFKPKLRNGGAPRRKIKVHILQSAETRAKFQSSLQSNLESASRPTNSSPDMLWEQLKTSIQQSSEEVLGYTSKKNRDWFDENDTEIKNLLAKKRSAYQAHLDQPPLSQEEGSLPFCMQQLAAETSSDPRQMVDRPRNVPILETTEASMNSLNQYLAHPTKYKVLCVAQTVRHSILTRLPFWTGGLNISKPSSVLTVKSKTLLSWVSRYNLLTWT